MHWFVRIWGSSSSQEQQPWCKDPGTFLGCLCRNNLDFPIFVKKKSSRTHPVWVRVGRGSDLAHHVLNIFLTSIHIQLNIVNNFIEEIIGSIWSRPSTGYFDLGFELGEFGLWGAAKVKVRLLDDYPVSPSFTSFHSWKGNTLSKTFLL